MAARPWQASYGSIPKEIAPEAQRSVVELLEQAMRRYADRPAMHCGGETLTYADLDRLSRGFAAWLQTRLGVKRGDRIAVMTPNVFAFAIAFLGIARAGAAQVNVNPMYTPRELEHQLNDAGVEIIVVHRSVAATVAEVLATTRLRHAIVCDSSDGAAGTRGMGGAVPADPRLPGSLAFADALAEGATLRFEPVELDGDDLLFMQYTGGTTGPSKGAALSHRNLVANIAQYKALMAECLRPGDEVIVTPIPLYHVMGLMVNFLTYFSLGAENWLLPDARDLDALVDTLRQARPTAFMGVNTLYAALIAHPRIAQVDWSRLRFSGGGGAAVIRAVSDRWQDLSGSFIREGYGMSETGPVLSFNPPSVREFNGSAGLPLPSTDIKLLDEDDREVGVGEAGEICARGPQVMKGYWNQPQANAAAFTADGYFRTGDVGVFDPAGFLRIVDRKKDMILVSGFNVYPNEVEAVATACPGVAECACIGVADAKTGEAVRLYVVRTPGSALTEAELVAHCRGQLTAYKLPRQVRFVAALPKSAVGKILRRELREQA